MALQLQKHDCNLELNALRLTSRCVVLAGIGLLSLFVFICSFIPIAGVFISTVPIAFVALTEYGFFQVCFDRCCVHLPHASIIRATADHGRDRL